MNLTSPYLLGIIIQYSCIFAWLYAGCMQWICRLFGCGSQGTGPLPHEEGLDLGGPLPPRQGGGIGGSAGPWGAESWAGLRRSSTVPYMRTPTPRNPLIPGDLFDNFFRRCSLTGKTSVPRVVRPRGNARHKSVKGFDRYRALDRGYKGLPQLASRRPHF